MKIETYLISSVEWYALAQLNRTNGVMQSIAVFIISSPGCSNLSIAISSSVSDNNMAVSHINHHRETGLCYCSMFQSLKNVQDQVVFFSNLSFVFRHIRGVFCSEWFPQYFSSSAASELHQMAAVREGPDWRRFPCTQLSQSSERLTFSPIWVNGPLRCQQATSVAIPKYILT